MAGGVVSQAAVMTVQSTIRSWSRVGAPPGEPVAPVPVPRYVMVALAKPGVVLAVNGDGRLDDAAADEAAVGEAGPVGWQGDVVRIGGADGPPGVGSGRWRPRSW